MLNRDTFIVSHLFEQIKHFTAYTRILTAVFATNYKKILKKRENMKKPLQFDRKYDMIEKTYHIKESEADYGRQLFRFSL